VELSIPNTVVSIGSYAFSRAGVSSLTIPDSVVSIDDSAFCYCSNLLSVFYQGSTTISTNIFSGSNALTTVCVSPDYKDKSFGGVDVTTSTSCNTFQSKFNHCYAGIFINGEFEETLRKNASDLENQQSECFEYHCDNETGAIMWSKCNSTVNNARICVDDRCTTEDDTPDDKKFAVELKITNMTIEELNITAFAEALSNISGIPPDAITLGVEVGDDGYVISVWAYFDDEESANNLAEAYADMDKGEGCAIDTLCKVQSARVVVLGLDVEASASIHRTLCVFIVIAVCAIALSF